MARKRIVLQNSALKVEIDPADLATDVTVNATGETLVMAPAQPDDVLIQYPGRQEWKSFTDSPITTRKTKTSLTATLSALKLQIKITLKNSDVIYDVSPMKTSGKGKPRDVLYPRHFILPRTRDAYAVFPFGQGSILPADKEWNFHHREGYSEAVMQWVGGYTGSTGYIQIAETPHDLYQAVDDSPGRAASCFIHWLGSLGELRYKRVSRITFGKGLDYVRQAKVYREWSKKIGWYKSLADKVAENPNVGKLRGAPIVTVSICSRRERTLTYSMQTFDHAAGLIEQFHAKTGYRNAVVHVDGWGYWGYDAMHPDVLPPHPEAGGVAGLSRMAARVKSLGYLFGLHDQYIDYYYHAPSFDQANSIVTESGGPVRINMWAGGACGHLSYRFIPDYVRRNYYEGIHKVYPINHNSPSIWEICAPTASYLDCFNRTREDWSPDHPMTREESRQLQNEIMSLVRNGKDGRMVVQSNEHPMDYCLNHLDFGWGIGHMMTDVPNTAGVMETVSLGVHVPLWHLCYHDALCLPLPGTNYANHLLYGQAPYFMLGFSDRFGKKEMKALDADVKKRVLALHRDVGFSDMTDHRILSDDGSVQLSVFDGGLEVEVDKKRGLYRVSDGAAKTRGLVPISGVAAVKRKKKVKKKSKKKK